MVPGGSVGRLSIIGMLPLLLLSFRNDQLGGLRLCHGFRVRVGDEFEFELQNATLDVKFYTCMHPLSASPKRRRDVLMGFHTCCSACTGYFLDSCRYPSGCNCKLTCTKSPYDLRPGSPNGNAEMVES